MFQPALAMIDDVVVCPKPTTPQNPFINELDKEGYTFLMRAVEKGDIELIQQLLEQGADLCIMPQKLKASYSNVLEYICDRKIRTFGREWKHNCIEWEASSEAILAYIKIIDTIVKHCMEQKISLSINTTALCAHDDTIETVWDYYFKCVHWALTLDYPDLFRRI